MVCAKRGLSFVRKKMKVTKSTAFCVESRRLCSVSYRRSKLPCCLDTSNEILDSVSPLGRCVARNYREVFRSADRVRCLSADCKAPR